MYGGTECNHFVGVEVVQRGLSEEGGDRLLNVQHTGWAADHNHALDVGFRHACVFQGLFDRLYGFLHQILRQVVKLLAGNDGMDFAVVWKRGFDDGFGLAGQLFFGSADKGKQKLAVALIEFRKVVLLKQVAEQAVVEIVAAQCAVAAGGFDFKQAFG